LTFQDRLEITTSEGVTVRMTIAGIGSRLLAWLIDGLVIGAVLVLVGFVGVNTFTADSLLALGLLSLAALAIPLGYVVAMETLNGGRTLGKMAAGIKVIRASGAPVGFGAAIVRALLAPVDFGLFGIGIVSLFVTPRSQRLGDLAASTVVVRDRSDVDAAPPPLAIPDHAPRWDVAGVTSDEIAVVRSFLGRAASLDPAARLEYAARLRGRLSPRVAGVDAALDDEAFLYRVVAEKDRDV